ncbi:putative laminin domain protein [Rhizoctonia solani 123E]|uniref:Putative laminin domain protein n=1 Tax=Rhizoctonia solani 123E TaxID=1423351 RepID=A0A074RI80_9AGAM|nr:putative laminin domain protein [Rhizoctonia solani 123E]
MAHPPRWYPPGQVCSPPELPAYLKNVYDLKPIIGLPSDSEVIGIHAVIRAARKASEIPGMHTPGLLMNLADHLFGAQMARYRSRYSLITFPSDATYTPPALPTHTSVKLESVSGAPTDEEMLKVQDAVRAYQHFEHVPSMFDQRVSMELSQHLFDLQMARHMRLAGETRPISVSEHSAEPVRPAPAVDQSTVILEDTLAGMNNAGIGANAPAINIALQPTPAIDTHELLERSNQLSERFNQVLERFSQAIERIHEPSLHSDQLSERFNQLLERLNLLTEQSNQLAQQSAARSAQPFEEPSQSVDKFNRLIEQSSQYAGRFGQLFEQLNGLISQLVHPLQRSNELSARANELAEQLNQLSERSNTLIEEAHKPVDRLEDVMKNINRVLVGIQHAIVRNCKDNKASAADCLVNEKGETPASSKITHWTTYGWVSRNYRDPTYKAPVIIGGVSQDLYLPESWLAEFVCFHGIWEGLCETGTSTTLIEGKENQARGRLGRYLSSRLG